MGRQWINGTEIAITGSKLIIIDRANGKRGFRVTVLEMVAVQLCHHLLGTLNYYDLA